MFGNVNSEVFKHLEFALDAVKGERGHRFEPVHAHPNLVQSEYHITQAIRLLEAYLKKAGN